MIEWTGPVFDRWLGCEAVPTTSGRCHACELLRSEKESEKTELNGRRGERTRKSAKSA